LGELKRGIKVVEVEKGVNFGRNGEVSIEAVVLI